MKIFILGSTGSIGTQCLSILTNDPTKFKVTGLAANANWQLMLKQCLKFNPKFAALNDSDSLNKLKSEISTVLDGIIVTCDQKRTIDFITSNEVDCVVAAASGIDSLLPLLAAIQAKKRILFANKELIVAAGDIIMRSVRENKCDFIPIDSEHSAIMQSLGAANFLPGQRYKFLKKIILTASGGQLRDMDVNLQKTVTPLFASKNPNWVMGEKISVDSTTMMNKIFEIIEASAIFNIAIDEIEVLLHRASIVHGMIELQDGSIISQMSLPDMKIPIACALYWPNVAEQNNKSIDFIGLKSLEFESLDLNKYPCFVLAKYILNNSTNLDDSMTILNAVNDVAVMSFLNNEIFFTSIYELINDAVSAIPIKSNMHHNLRDIEYVMYLDNFARKTSRELIKKYLK